MKTQPGFEYGKKLIKTCHGETNKKVTEYISLTSNWQKAYIQIIKEPPAINKENVTIGK